MKFVLRDDDASFFTRPEQLDAVYHDVWDRVPVTLAVIPQAAGYRDKAVPPQYWDATRAFPLDENPALVARLGDLLSAGRVTIAQHGFTHEDFADGPEFQAAPDVADRVRRGREYLERLFDRRVDLFVPPHNALSKSGMAAVHAAGLNLLGSFVYFHPSRRPWDRRTPANWWRVLRYRAATGRNRSDRAWIYPHVLRYVNQAEFGCHSLIPGTTFDGLVAGFEEARRAGGHFCLATHYWEVDAALKSVLVRLLDYAAAVPGMEFVPAERLFDPES